MVVCGVPEAIGRVDEVMLQEEISASPPPPGRAFPLTPPSSAVAVQPGTDVLEYLGVFCCCIHILTRTLVAGRRIFPIRYSSTTTPVRYPGS